MITEDIFQPVIVFLVHQYLSDMAFLGQPWLWFTVIPGLLCLTFVFLKWLILTLPIWLPIRIILDAFTPDK